jgi:hypothetical protein
MVKSITFKQQYVEGMSLHSIYVDGMKRRLIICGIPYSPNLVFREKRNENATGSAAKFNS